MLMINGPAAVATTSEVKKNLPKMFKEATKHPVYVTSDGQPVGALIGMEDMAILEEALADRALQRLAAQRLDRVRHGDAELIDADRFFADMDAEFAATRRMNDSSRKSRAGRARVVRE